MKMNPPSTGTRSAENPMFSVIVPAYNASTELGQCLAALADSEFDDFEVLVVDDGSTV